MSEPATDGGPPPGLEVPKTLGACADLYFKLRNERLAAQKGVDAIEAREKYMMNHLIKHLPAADASGVAGKVARVTRHVKRVPTVKDWAALYVYIKKTGAFELLQRRVADAAVKERWDAGKQVPGVEAFTTVTLSVAKV